MTIRPKSSAAFIAELHAGQAKFPAAAVASREHVRQLKVKVDRYQMDPSIYLPAEIAGIVAELEAAKQVESMLDDNQVEYLQRHFEANFFRDNAGPIADSLLHDLEATAERMPSKIEALKKWLSDLPGKIYQPTISEDEKTALLEERDRRETDAQITANNIRDCRSEIEYFRANPTAANYGGPAGLLGQISSRV